MKKDKEDPSVEVNDNNEKPSKCALPLLLLINLLLITAILFVSALWYYSREHSDMNMIPSPDKDRSISVPTEAPGEKHKKLQPEEYISSQIDKVKVYIYILLC